ncbi:MAG: hypothetical protein KKC18_04595, partial [Chloroflexi bacterium]|nr:hypothetical protein [Chloroflexota bacterium]
GNDVPVSDTSSQFAMRHAREYRFVLVWGIVALAVASAPYLLGATLATESRIFGGFVYAVEDGYAYLAHMREGANGNWLFTLPYTPEPHTPRLFYLFHLLLGKLAALLPGNDLTARMVWVYHGARVIFGLGLLLTVYRFLAEFTQRLAMRRLAWLMTTFGGGLGWLLVALGQPNWLGSIPLDFILPEGFTFLVLYSFPHIALARTLLLWGILFMLKAWEEHPNPQSLISNHKHALLTGISWLLMGLIVPFYVAVAWAVTGAALLALWLRNKSVPWREGLLAGVAVLLSTPVVAYSAWVFTTDRVYATWAAQNLILSPHPFHYLAAYGIPLLLAALAVRAAWRSERPAWLPLAWVAIVPLLVYLPFNLQRRLIEGAQIPLNLLAAWGLVKISKLQAPSPKLKSRLIIGVALVGLSLTNVLLVAGNSLALRGQPAPIYRDAGEIGALDWLNERVEPDDVILASYATGNYLPARVGARVFVGHGPESIQADEKKALAAQFFDATTDDTWRQHLLAEYGVDYVFWGPAERALGAFDPNDADFLIPGYCQDGYAIFRVVR